MAVVIRLSRKGTKKKPHHKIVVMDERKPRDGRFLEQLGYYDPSKKPVLLQVKEDRILYWLSKGARITPTVKSFLANKKVPLASNKGGK